MGEIEKLTIIKQSGFLAEIEYAAYNLLANYEDNVGSDDFEEEKSYMEAVSRSVSVMGRWCLSTMQILGSAEDPFKDP